MAASDYTIKFEGLGQLFEKFRNISAKGGKKLAA